jgi:hypothetical protein
LYNLKKINELLDGPQKTLQNLRVSAERAEGVLEASRELLPVELGDGLLAASVEGAELILVTDSGARATRLRYAGAEHLSLLSARLGVSLSRVRVRVRRA